MRTHRDRAPTGRGRRAAAVQQRVEVLLVAEEAVAPRGGEEAAEAQQQPRHGDGEPGRGVTDHQQFLSTYNTSAEEELQNHPWAELDTHTI